DIFVKKSPATTIESLAHAIKELYKSSSEIRVIGSRHGEKLFETLVNREEMVKAEDMGDYFKIPADTRDLNYNKFFTEGTEAVSQVEEYTSHNTKRLDVEETKELLLTLSFIRQDVLNEGQEAAYEP
ncbi:MAG TPA: UDP-glucose 4-epimerase, partial [Bacteroidales bacterium]|nr:UDP-glucose 4-epimerase [Bacteroidales bacterium]